jgi:hypothetical protein
MGGSYIVVQTKDENSMRLLATAWYSFGLLVVAAVAESATTYVPSAQAMGDWILAVTSGLAAFAGLGATCLAVFRKRKPQSPIFQSKAASTIALSLAAVLTVT